MAALRGGESCKAFRFGGTKLMNRMRKKNPIRPFRISETLVYYIPDLQRSRVEQFIKVHGRDTPILMTQCKHCKNHFSVAAHVVLRAYLLNKRVQPDSRSWKPRQLCYSCFNNKEIRVLYIKLPQDVELRKSEDRVLEGKNLIRSALMRRAIGNEMKFRVLLDSGEVRQVEGTCEEWNYSFIRIRTPGVHDQEYPSKDLVRGSVQVLIPSSGNAVLDFIRNGMINIMTNVSNRSMGQETDPREVEPPAKFVRRNLDEELGAVQPAVPEPISQRTLQEALDAACAVCKANTDSACAATSCAEDPEAVTGTHDIPNMEMDMPEFLGDQDQDQD